MTRDLVKPHQPLHSALSWLGRAATPQLKIHPGARGLENGQVGAFLSPPHSFIRTPAILLTTSCYHHSHISP